jgi:hypothetical protein
VYLPVGQNRHVLGGESALSELESQRLVHSAIMLEGEPSLTDLHIGGWRFWCRKPNRGNLYEKRGVAFGVVR